MKEYRSPHAAITVIEAIAAAEGEEPLDLGYALEEYIPVDAIEALAANGQGDWNLRFSVPDRTVTIDSEGSVTIDGTEFQWTGGR